MASISKTRVRVMILIAAGGLGLTTTLAALQNPSVPQGLKFSLDAGGTSSPNVSVSPVTATLNAGGVAQFIATTSGAGNQSVSWSATGGTISSNGYYTAGQVPGTFRVMATVSGGSWGVSGSAAVSIQTTSPIEAAVGQSLQSVINGAPEGATILLKAGIHRLETATPKNGQTIVGEAGAILSGARLLTSFARSGSAWTVNGQTQEASGAGECESTAPLCTHPEDVFFDNMPLHHVGALSDGGPGKWYFDYPNDTIYLWDDPTGHTVETSVIPYALDGTATNVTIKNIIVEKYANPAQNGAIRGGTSWVIDSSEVRLNHGIGVGMADNRRVTNNKIHHNGQLGIGGSGTNALVEANEIAYNNVAGYNPYWEAGGTKFTFSKTLAIRGNFVHHNDGPGLWTDINNIDVTIENNRVEDNGLSGIFHEISYQAIIRNNTISRNGTSKPTSFWVDGAGILVSSSSDVEVYGNTLVDNFQGITGLEGNRGSGLYGAWILKNLYVHNNDVTQSGTTASGTGRTGVEQTGGGTSAFTSANNKFASNTYRLGTAVPQRFFWMHQNVDDNGWKGYGQDTSGTFIH
jgi:parallel beta-helix repeat protein